MLVYHFEGVPRSPLGVALKNILTLGIYTKVWLYRVNREMDGHEGFHIDLRWLAVMVVLPIITPIIVKFQTARRLNMMVGHQVTLPLMRARTLGWISIVPVLGAGFYAYRVQSSLNRHWFHHRREERMRLARDRIRALAAAPEDEVVLAKRARLEDEVRRLEQEIRDEEEAVRIRWGEDAFNERRRRAEVRTAGGRKSRTELAKLRAEEKERRRREKARRKQQQGARGRLFGLLPPKTEADPDDEAFWQPKTPLPERMPEEIEALAAGEDRELTAEETKELKTAKRLVARREKEATTLEKAREKARQRKEKRLAKEAQVAEKKRAAEEKREERLAAKAEARGKKEAAKAGKAKKAKPPKKAKAPRAAKPPKKAKKAKKTKAGKAPQPEPPAPAAESALDMDQDLDLDMDLDLEEDLQAEPEKGIPVGARRAPPPAATQPADAGALRILTITCPRCRTTIPNVQKKGDAPAKITCPSCGLVGKV